MRDMIDKYIHIFLRNAVNLNGIKRSKVMYAYRERRLIILAKSDIFTKRTIVPPKAVEHVDTALEALTLSIAEKARVDFEYMSSLTGMTEDELKHDLTGEIFKIPHTENEYQTASEYLSGDIRKKLREAEEIAEYDPDFNINVSALKQAMPEPLKAGDIDIKLGAACLLTALVPEKPLK